jgi:hypothetical protein
VGRRNRVENHLSQQSLGRGVGQGLPCPALRLWVTKMLFC